MSLLRNRIRLALEVTKPLDTKALTDYSTGAVARMSYARAVQFELAIYNDGVLDDLASIQSVTLTVKPLTTAGVIDVAESTVLEKTVASGTFNSALTADQWTNDSGSTPYHALISFTAAQTGVNMTGDVNNELTFGLVFSALTAEGRITLATGYLTLVKDGADESGLETPPVPSYTMSDSELDARFASKAGFTGNPAGAAQIWTSAAGKSMRLYIRDEPDGTITFAAEEIT